jgi:hypothetical protein
MKRCPILQDSNTADVYICSQADRPILNKGFFKAEYSHAF